MARITRSNNFRVDILSIEEIIYHFPPDKGKCDACYVRVVIYNEWLDDREKIEEWEQSSSGVFASWKNSHHVQAKRVSLEGNKSIAELWLDRAVVREIDPSKDWRYHNNHAIKRGIVNHRPERAAKSRRLCPMDWAKRGRSLDIALGLDTIDEIEGGGELGFKDYGDRPYLPTTSSKRRRLSIEQ